MSNLLVDREVVKLCADLGDLARAGHGVHAFRTSVTELLCSKIALDFCMVISTDPDAFVAGKGWSAALLRERNAHYCREVLDHAGLTIFEAPQKGWFEMVDTFRQRGLTTLD